jgi:alpha-galactosidase
MLLSEMILSPDNLMLQTEDGWVELERTSAGHWAHKDAEVCATPAANGLKVSLTAADTAVCRLMLVWKTQACRRCRLLGDHWERGYGDLEWRGIVPERVLPWYFLLFDGRKTDGLGVMTGPAALCFWKADEDAVTLCLDVRCGGSGVRLGGRAVELATVTARDGLDSETPYQAARAFCAQMCPRPRLPKEPVYGGNNWYYAYGKSSQGEIEKDTDFIATLAPAGGNRPYMVIDMCWERPLDTPEQSRWQGGNSLFPDMGALADYMKKEGVRPGIWTRPLSMPDHFTERMSLPEQRVKLAGKLSYPGRFLDPSIPEALEIVRADAASLAAQGYELIKHDFTTFDLLGRWGFEMGWEVTNEGWSFSDRTKTTAEVILGLYRALRQGAGDALVIGCNTVGHLAAGLFEMQRTGDDTSGRQWERTRKMGVNTLAFAMPKHGTFYASDADCAAVTNAVPWELGQQWLTLLAASGTPLFVSAPPTTAPEQRRAIREAFALASKPLPTAEPLDWLDTTCPASWLLNGERAEFHWSRRDCLEFCD